MRHSTVSVPAQRDLNEIVVYLAEEASIGAARRALADLKEAIRLLAKNPHLGHFRQDLTDEPYRSWKVHSHFVIYDPTRTPIEIVRVLHTARDVEGLL